jgi:hypothetical protein
MKLFNCKVRLNGEVKDEVARNGVTNAEIKILRSIHGDDAVVDIVATGEDAKTAFADDDGMPQFRARTEADERARLDAFYTEAAVARIFGVARPSITDEPSAIEDAMRPIVPLEPPVRAEPKPFRQSSKLQLEDVG